MTPSDLLTENAAREAALRATWDAYDPITGAGSPVPRRAVRYSEAVTLHLPLSMWEDAECGAMLAWCTEHGRSLDAYVAGRLPFDQGFEDWFNRCRIRHDYEFWTATCIRIEEKPADDESDGQEHEKVMVPFVLNPSQRQTLKVREDARREKRPVRIIQLKHRQYGSTTDYAFYEFWHQVVALGTGNYYIISLEGGGASKIRRRIELALETYPAWAGKVELKGVSGAPNSNEVIVDGKSVGMLSTGSVNNPQAPSGDTNRRALISEVGKMSSTDVHSAERLITNVMSTVPMAAGTLVVMESTAEGSGRYFKRAWDKAMTAKPGARKAFTPLFVSWMSDPTCTLALPDTLDVEAWVGSWDPYLTALWSVHKCSLSQILWYDEKRDGYPSPEDMMQENPTTADEAFKTAGSRVFRRAHVDALRVDCLPPVRYAIDAVSPTGRRALQTARLYPTSGGPLSVWHLPSETYDGLLETDTHDYTDPFVLAMDIGGTWAKADYTVVGVLDRRPTYYGLPAVLVAEWHGHLDTDLAAWQAAMLAKLYGSDGETGMLAIEVNSLEEDKGESGEKQEEDQSLAALEALRGAGVRLYRRRVMDKRTREVTQKLGWHTNRPSKNLAVGLLKSAMRVAAGEPDDEALPYTERSLDACNEMDHYIEDERGRMMAESGKDDRVMVRSILLAVHSQMPACRAVPKRRDRDERRRIAHTPSGYAAV